MSHIIDEDDTYTFEILQEKHLEESAKLLANVFTKYNPLEIFMKTTYEESCRQALTLLKAVLDEKLSMVVIRKQTNEIYGVSQVGDASKLIGQDFKKLEPTDDSEMDDELETYHELEIYNDLERRFIEHYGALKENDVALILMVGIHEDCCGIGLCTKFQQILLNHCRQRGFTHAIVETTNPIMHHIYTKKLNGKEFASIYLPTFVTSHGRRPFEHYEGTVPLIIFYLLKNEK